MPAFQRIIRNLLILIGIGAVLAACSGGVDYTEWAKEFFRELSWYEWIIFILMIALIVLLILALLGVELAVTVVAAIVKAALFLLELIWVVLRALFLVLRGLLSALVDGLKSLIGVIRAWLPTVPGCLAGRFPWLRRLWDLVGGNAVWDLIKEAAGWIKQLIGIIIGFLVWLFGNGSATEDKFIIPCGEVFRTPAVRRTARVIVRDYPFGKSGAEIEQEAIAAAEAEARRVLTEELEALAGRFQCAPGCQATINIAVTIIPPTTAPMTGYGLFDSYEGTATAEGTLTIRCGD